MAVGTLVLHAAVIGLGLAAVNARREWLVRAGGMGIAGAFVVAMLIGG